MRVIVGYGPKGKPIYGEESRVRIVSRGDRIALHFDREVQLLACYPIGPEFSDREKLTILGFQINPENPNIRPLATQGLLNSLVERLDRKLKA